MNAAAGALAPSVFQFQSIDIRAFADECGEPWFCAADVCAVLGYANSRDAITKHCREGGVAKRDTPTESGNQEMTFINEGNLYRLIIKSRKPEALAFEQQVMEVILPAIRKTGRYEHAAYTAAPTDTLTAGEADLLRTMLRDAVSLLPSEQRASFMIAGWSKLKAHFGVSYRSIPRAEFEEAVSLVARHIADRTPAQVTHIGNLPDDAAHIQRCIELANAARIQIFAALSASAPGSTSRARLLVSVDGAAAHSLKLDREDCVFKLAALPEIIRDPALLIENSLLTDLITASADRLASRMGNNRTRRVA